MDTGIFHISFHISFGITRVHVTVDFEAYFEVKKCDL